jgi:hypothetical protein
MDWENAVGMLSAGVWILVFVVGVYLLFKGENVLGASASLPTIDLQFAGVSLAWAIGATGFSIALIAFAELIRLVHSQFLKRKMDIILRRLPEPGHHVLPQAQPDQNVAPQAPALAIPSAPDVLIELDLLPESSWYRLSRTLHLGHIVAGINYRLALKIKNLTGRVLNNIVIKGQVGILSSAGQLQFQTTIEILRLRARERRMVMSPNQFLMRQIGTGDLLVTGIRSDGQNLAIQYQGQPNLTFLTSYESEARKAISDRAIGIIDLIFASGFIALVLKLYFKVG